jgi:basic membrane protein A
VTAAPPAVAVDTSATSGATSATECAGPDVFCVGLITNAGGIDDKSFNQSAYEGLKMAEEQLGAVIDYVEMPVNPDYSADIARFAEQGFDVIVTVGFAAAQVTVDSAQQYPNIKFIGVDQFQPEAVDNLAGLIFNDDRAGFLAGALAAQMSKSNTIAAVFGSDAAPPVVAFKEGFENGAKYVKPDIDVSVTYHPGGMEIAFTDPDWGAATAKEEIERGADVIFGAGGTTGNGALTATANQSGVYCIGVDTDQWETVPEARPCLISSAMKEITPGVFELIKQAKEGTFPSGNYFGQVKLAPFHDFEAQIPADVKTRLTEIDAGLKDGSIEIGYEPFN